jgi:CheY-like chemotaxis protein
MSEHSDRKGFGLPIYSGGPQKRIMHTMTAESSKLRVLLVEDAMLTADQLRELLQQTVHSPEVVVASTEDEALASVTLFEPHVVIMDLKLRQGTGFGVLRTLASKEHKPLTIVLTNYALPKYREFAKLSGADYFLDKAFDFSTLAHILNSIPRSKSKPAVTVH